MSDPKDVREMRERINRAAYGRERVDEKPLTGIASIAPSASMIRSVLTLAERDGWSGEDKMTVLAYHALVRCEDLYDKVLEFYSTSPSSFIVPKELP